MAKQRLNSPQLKPSTSVTDANGWQILDLGSFKIYTKRVTTTLSSFNGPAFITGLQSNLPVGVTDFNSMISFGATFTYNGSGNLRLTQESMTSATTINVVGTTTAASNSVIMAYYQVIA